MQERFERAYRTASTPLARLEAVIRAYVQCGFDHPHEYELTFMTALPKLRSHNAMRKVRAQRQRGAAVLPEDENGGTRVFGLLEGVVGEVLHTYAGAGAVAGTARSTRTRTIAALSEVIWAGGHGLVALVNTHQNFGFSNRQLLIDTAVSSMLHGIERMTIPPRQMTALPRKVARRARRDPS